MTRRLRPIVAPFVVARSAGARVRTRLPVSDHDEQVLRAVGELHGGIRHVDLGIDDVGRDLDMDRTGTR